MTGFYARLRDKREDDQLLQDCIESVINKLEGGLTTSEKPGMLLGKIQSGKTRGFLGIILRAFDRDYDIALVFTKGTKTLAKQTVRRISHDFKDFIDDEEISVYDIMEMPDRLTKSELKRKIVIVAKKETRNLTRVLELFQTTYPGLAEKKVLLVDDEADMASVRFVKQRGTNNFQQGTIAQQMDDLRALIPSISFLQVTATPYALYLQPEEYEPQANQYEFYPKKPEFTELLPIHSGYVGGDEYFGSFEEDDFRHYLYVQVSDIEQDALRTCDARQIRSDRIWVTANIVVLRQALMTFLLAVVIRRWQQEQQDQRKSKFSMIIHNDTQRKAHNFQWTIVERLREVFEQAAETNDPQLIELFNNAFEDLTKSVQAHGGHLPDKSLALKLVKELILDGEVNVQRVNSDVELTPLLDSDTAELKLRAQANVFIGGSILDRGITVPSLIAFYYGRNPRTMQADTVLQHSRMYGNRSHQDLAVTRFYTSAAVYDRLDEINKLETTLREAFEKGAHDSGVVFLENDANQGIIPCSPTKVSVSNIVTVRSKDFLLPTNFDTPTAIGAKNSAIQLTEFIYTLGLTNGIFKILDIDTAIAAINLAKKSIVLNKDTSFQWDAMESLLSYYCKSNNSGEVEFMIDTGRKIDRVSSGDKSGRSILGTALRDSVLRNGRSRPALIMLQQTGTTDLSWSGGYEFWWPILASPTECKPCVFANK